MTPTNLIIAVGAYIRIAIFFPIRVLLHFLGVPNTRIVYKSGHVEYYYFKKLKWRIAAGGC